MKKLRKPITTENAEPMQNWRKPGQTHAKQIRDQHKPMQGFGNIQTLGPTHLGPASSGPSAGPSGQKRVPGVMLADPLGSFVLKPSKIVIIK